MDAPGTQPAATQAPLFEAASSPHLTAGDSVPTIMWTVVAALLPAAAVGVFYFGAPALVVLVTAAAGCVACEALFQRLMGRPVAVADGSAALTGLLLGMNLPPAAPPWLVLVGCAVAIFLGKLVFGGLGWNPFNPALVARVFLLISFPVQMTTWSPPLGLFSAAPDAVTAATPLGAVKMELLTKGTALAAGGTSLLDGLVGRLPGSAGETSVLALALGGAFLLWRGIITWHIPASFLGAVAALAAALHAVDPARFPGAGFHLVTGGLVLGALFMATDYVTSPVTPRGMLVYGAGCGLLTWLIRSFGGYPEGVSFAILLMNMLTPLIDTCTRPRVFGEVTARG
jgi:Na+-translocating ferredoxin:NAD+ oxidoreductase subunit D